MITVPLLHPQDHVYLCNSTFVQNKNTSQAKGPSKTIDTCYIRIYLEVHVKSIMNEICANLIF